MSLTIRLTGTGGAQLVPVFGCDCPPAAAPASTKRIVAVPVARSSNSTTR